MICPRCSSSVTVTYSRKGTARVHAHKCKHGVWCRLGTPCDFCIGKINVRGEPWIPKGLSTEKLIEYARGTKKAPEH